MLLHQDHNNLDAGSYRFPEIPLRIKSIKDHLEQDQLLHQLEKVEVTAHGMSPIEAVHSKDMIEKVKEKEDLLDG